MIYCMSQMHSTLKNFFESYCEGEQKYVRIFLTIQIDGKKSIY